MSQTNVNVPGDGSQGMGAGMIVGLVLAIVVIGFIVWWFLLGGGGDGTTPGDSADALQSAVESVVQSVLPSGS